MATEGTVRRDGEDYPFALVEAACLLPHERINESYLRTLTEEIRSDGVLRHPVIVDRTSLVILDGHHRVAALKRLGCTFVPAYLLDYSDPSIMVEGWRSDFIPDKEAVIRSGISGALFPPKTSRHVLQYPPRAHPVSLAVLKSLKLILASRNSAI